MLRNRLECKINYTLLALLPNKFNMTMQGLATSGENIRSIRAIPTLAIIQGIAAIGGMMIKGINALVDAKRASSFNNAIKLVNENVQIVRSNLDTHLSDTPFAIWQPIQRPRLLERVYKPIHTPHWCRVLQSSITESIRDRV